MLQGKRVVLLPMESKQTAELFEAGRYAEIWEYMSIRVKTYEDMGSVVKNALAAKEQGAEFPFVVKDLETNSIIGSTRLLNISKENKNAEIGWTWYTPSVWRSRVNTECKYLLLQHCFEELDMIRVQFKTDSRNIRSQKAIARLGALKEGVLRKDRIVAHNYVRDSVVFSILRDEWPTVKVRLEGFLKNQKR
ncbi:GNAT family protein [Bacillus sp. 165]|uniref:GNAT family N-acetyltransferase n=1 Tax=Bacillus sp. 165 TaxID=1529117 RepID=UPI001ADB2560|nr:GNAT family protein [Bacillus sp. 165]MBO9128108.1 GNAT family N-acetyltransferase [Bacillus sp. 165]